MAETIDTQSLSFRPAPEVGITLAMRGLPTLDLFRRGFDTHQIAKVKGQPEHVVYKWLCDAKEAERNK